MFFFGKNHVETYQGLQGSKNRPWQFRWAGLDSTSRILQLKDDSIYISSDEDKILQGNLLKIITNKSKDD